MTVTVIQPDAAAGKDTFITDNAPTTNYGTFLMLYIGKRADNAKTYRSLLQLDLTVIPDDDVVDEAALTLTLDNAQDYATDIGHITVHRMLRPWVETEATWGIAATGTNWGTAGAGDTASDREATAIGLSNDIAATYGAATGITITLDAASVQAMCGETPPFENNGFLLRTVGESADMWGYRPSDYGTAASRPKLTITHHTPPATCPVHLLRSHYLSQGVR